MPERILLHVLGPTRTTPEMALTTMQRTVLAAVALQHPRPIGVGELAERVWPDDTPNTARAALQNQISRLRSALPAPALETTPGGYRWSGRLDTLRLQDGLRCAEALLTAGEFTRAYAHSDRILSDITGDAFEDLPDADDVLLAREHTRAQRYGLENIRLLAAIGDGAREWALAEADQLARNAPLDEQRHALYAQALAAVGRRGEALAVLASFRRRTRDELGLATTNITAEAEQTILDADSPATTNSSRGEIVGRTEEIERTLNAVLEGRNVYVRSEPGMGVSSFLTRISTSFPREEWKVIFVRHTPTFDATPLEVLREIISLLDGPKVATWRLLTSFASLVDTVRQGKRLLIVIDDADLLGPSTHRALHEASQIAEIVLVTGNHSSVPSDVSCEAVELHGLDQDSIIELALSGYGRMLTATEADELLRSTAGSPLLLHALLVTEEEVGPGHMRGAVLRRLAKLSPTARAALDWVAVSAGTIPAPLLVKTNPDVALIGTEDPELLDTPTLTFRHDAIRTAVYDDIPDAHRVELHHILACVAAEHTLPALTVAAHAIPASALDPTRAIDAARQAAREATAVGAHLDTAEILTRAIDAIPEELPEHLDLRILRGDALRLAGDPAHLALLQDAAADAIVWNRPHSLAEAMFALLQLGATSVVGQIDDRTLSLTQQALSVLKNQEHLALVNGAASLSLSMSGQAEEALTAFRQAEQHATIRATRNAILPFAYLALGHPDDREERARFTDELINHGRESEDTRALWEGLHQRFSGHALLGNRREMQAAHDEMVALMPGLGDVGRAWSIRYQEAALAHLDGDLDRAEALAYDAYRIFSPVSEARATSALQGQILGIRLTQQRTEELAATLRTLIAAQPSVPAWHAALGHATALIDPNEARTHLALALEHAHRDFTWLATHVVGARAAALIADQDLSRRYLEALAPYSGLSCWQGTCTYGPVATALSQVAAICNEERAAQFKYVAARVAENLGSTHYQAEIQ